MRKIFILFFAIGALSSCMVEHELDPPYIYLSSSDEFETREVIKEVWSGDILLYEEVQYHAWLELEFRNTGGLEAFNVRAEVNFYDGYYQLHSVIIRLPDMRSGKTYVHAFDTGFESMFDYTDYEVNIYWD